jgi:hypothetical protein
MDDDSSACQWIQDNYQDDSGNTESQAPPFDADLGGNNKLDPQNDGRDLTPAQKTGKVVTTLLVEVVIVAPAEGVLIASSVAAAELGPIGILLELVLVPADIAVADFGISLLKNTWESVSSGQDVDFEWTILPIIISELPESWQEDIRDIVPSIVP